MKNHNLDQRLDFIGLDLETRTSLRGLKPLIESELPRALDAFYDEVRRVPEIREKFGSEAHISSAHSAQMRHWRTISDATYDDVYVDAVRSIGETHARIGLEPRWYIGGYAHVANHLINAMVERAWPKASLFGGKNDGGKQLADDMGAFLKATMLDMDFAISVYFEAAERERKLAEATAIADQQRIVNASFGEGFERMASGDFTRGIESGVPEEYEQLRLDFNATITQLATTVETIASAAQEIKSGSGEISQASDDLSRRTEQQAASLEETAAALDEITATVSHTADGAGHARDIVASTRTNAERGEKIVREAIEAMSGIAHSSREVGQIVGVIDEIAFQTNLLALNAGVEAARAGDAGRGFAVVASEVRALAQRSAEAAKEIKALISASTQQVDLGVKLVGQTGESLGEILGQMSEINTAVAAIAASANEQASGLGQVNIAVNQMDQVTQQNAAMVEQTTAASHALSREAATLDELVSHFKSPASTVTKMRKPAEPARAPSAAPARSAPVARFAGSAARKLSPTPAASEDGWEEF